MIKENNTLHLIQLLRGIASLLVVFFHITINYNNVFHQSFLGNLFAFGGSGVDVFFVLSGFIITYTNSQNISQPAATGNFVKRRFIRIFPIYWIIITLFLAAQLLLPQFYKTGFTFTAPNIISTYLLFIGHQMVNGVSWSLSNELFFYLLFVISFLLPSKRLALILLIAYTLLLLVLGAGNFNDNYTNPYIGTVLYPMNIEFFMGVFVALIFNRVSIKPAIFFIILGTALFIAGATLSNYQVVLFNNSFNRVMLFGVPSFFVMLGVTALEIHKKITVSSFFLKLGDASYSIYLLHLPLVAAYLKLLVKLNISNNIFIHFLLLLFIVAICIAGIAIYRFVEKPIIKKLNKALL